MVHPAQLNLLNDEEAENLRSFYQELLDDAVGGFLKHDAETKLAFLSWRAGDEAAMRAHFARAVKEHLALFKQHLPINHPIDITQLVMPSLIALSFGDHDDQLELAALLEKIDRGLVAVSHLALFCFLRLVANTVITGRVDVECLMDLFQKNRSPESDYFYREWIGLYCQGLDAIRLKNPDMMVKAINGLLAIHHAMALEKDWKKLVEGLMSVWAYSLQQLAQKMNISVSINSIYIPK